MKVFGSFLIGFIFLSGSFESHAQSMIGDSHAQQSLEQTEDWLKARRYEKVQEIVGPLTQHSNPDLAEQAHYFQLIASVYLSDAKALDLVDNFVQRYPTSIYATDIYFKLAGQYFDKGQYTAALPWFVKVTPSQLNPGDLMTYYFSYGYSRFAVKDYKGALPLLNRVVTDNKFGAKATYYIGYASYAMGDYTQAKDVFKSSVQGVSKDQNGYFLADIYFKEANFSNAVETALAYMPKAAPKEVSELNKIIGESYFNMKEYAQAIPYLQAYKGKRRRWTPEDYYQLGYSYYATQDYEKAQSNFNKITAGKDALSQNAYYYLGASYLKNNQKSAAVNAFKKASTLPFSKEISKEASLQYAKLSYEEGNPFEAIGGVLENFIKDYPEDPQTAQLKELLLNAFLLEKNYQGALDLAVKMPDLATKRQRQDLALRAGLEALGDSQYKSASKYLDYVVDISAKNDLAAQAFFWQSELALRTYDYASAFKVLNALEPLSETLPKSLQWLIHYQRGYAYFKSKDYSKAISEFKLFEGLSKESEDLDLEFEETLVRTADAYYSLGDFKSALLYYDKTLQKVPRLKAYAAFNAAMAVGLMGQTNEKISRLQNFDQISVSPSYYAKALLELGIAHAAQDQVTDAIDSFDKLISLFPKAAIIPAAMLKKGLLLYNQSEPEAALAVFKQMGTQFKTSDEFSQARATAKRIYLDLGQVKQYRDWMALLEISIPDNEDLDQESYEQLMLRNANASIIEKTSRLEGYLNDFPNGLHYLEIKFDLANMYNEMEIYDKALPLYEALIQASSPDSEAALMALVTIKLEQKIGGDPTEDLKNLLSIAQDPSHYTYALTNLMKRSYETKQYTALISYANQVLALESVATPIRQDAQIMLARAAQAQGADAKAMAAYSELSSEASGSLGAESLYWVAFYTQKSGDYSASNELVQELAREYAPYKEWAAKGLLLMAENFYALDDLFQAHFIWQNIVDNFSQYPDLIDQAKNRLAATKQDPVTPNSDDE